MSKLDVTLPGPTRIRMTRSFDAPRALVVKAMTDPELLKRWLGGTRATVVSAEVDARAGGAFKYVYRNNRDGSTFSFSGVYRELSEERAVHTERFGDLPGESVVTTTWTEAGDVTTMTLDTDFGSQAIRDMVLQTGMADGAGESYDALAELLR